MSQESKPVNAASANRRMALTLADFHNGGKLPEAEQTLLEHSVAGTLAEIATRRPLESTAGNRVRASFLRFLALGGDPEATVHEHGIRIKGAWIEGDLDLENCAVATDLSLPDCSFNGSVILRDATILALNLNGSSVTEVSADRLRCGPISLRDGFLSHGIVALSGCVIGDIDCTGGVFAGGMRGALLLDGADIRGSVNLAGGFSATGAVQLSTATVSGNLICNGGHFDAVTAQPTPEAVAVRTALFCEQMKVGGSILLNAGFEANGLIRLTAARIGGNVECVGGHIAGTRDGALLLDGADIKGSVNLGAGFSAKGAVQLSTATVAGNLAFTGSLLQAWDMQQSAKLTTAGYALFCDQAQIGGSVFMNDKFHAIGAVRLVAARIGGALLCQDGLFDNPNGDALNFEQAKLGASAFLSDGFCANGTVRLTGADVTGYLVCTGGKFETPGGLAMIGEQAKIGGHLTMTAPFSAKGMINFSGAHVDGNVECVGAGFIEGTNAGALLLYGAEIKGSAAISRGFAAKGAVVLSVARIGGDLHCDAGSFDAWNSSGTTDLEKSSLLLDSVEIGRNAYLRYGFRAAGLVRLDGAHINGNLDCRDGTFDCAGGVSLNCQRLRVAGDFAFRNVHHIAGDINLAGATVATLLDDNASWDNAAQLVLDGFCYDRIRRSGSIGPDSFIQWLNKEAKGATDAGFKPQPWEHLIKVMRDTGATDDARHIAIAKQKQRRKLTAGEQKAGFWNAINRHISDFFYHSLLGNLVGYGYRPLRLFYLAVGVWLACAALFHIAADRGAMAPTDARLYSGVPGNPWSVAVRRSINWTKYDAVPREYTTFNAPLYSLDLILPLVGLQQKRDWTPMTTQPCVSGRTLVGFCTEPANQAQGARVTLAYWAFGVLVWIAMWTEILFGWLASLLFAAVVSGLVKRD